MKTVAIIDYGISNLFSVNQACIHSGLKPVITNDKCVIEEADALILPGVGSFKQAMENLSGLKIIETMKDSILENKPFMGICLGYQLLFSESEEFGRTDGLDLFEGVVKRFSNGENSQIKVPQVGWNNVRAYDIEKWNISLLGDVLNGEFMYFVHSYFVETNNASIMLTETEYEGTKYCSSIQSGNIFGSQYHPEKSGVEGLKIYQKFAQIINEGV